MTQQKSDQGAAEPRMRPAPGASEENKQAAAPLSRFEGEPLPLASPQTFGLRPDWKKQIRTR
jgi:hypothetical protein